MKKEPGMKVLLLDTSLQGALLGIADVEDKAGKILRVHQTAVPQEAAAALPQLCEKVLSDAGLSRSDIDTLIVGIGPGSFTGIKIGLSYAMGWKLARPQLQLYGVSALRGFVKSRSEKALWALPATQKAGYFMTNAEGITIGIADLEEPSPFFANQGDGNRAWDPPSGLPLRIIGSWPKLEEYAESKKIERTNLETTAIGAQLLAGMLEEFIANSENLSEGELKPLYLRKSAPEEKADRENSQKQQR